MRILYIVFMCLIVQGCTFYRHTVLTISGKNISAPIAGLVATVKGDDIVLDLNRTLCIGDCANVEFHEASNSKEVKKQ